MSIVDQLKAAGFKPEASTDGEWKPYTGTYQVEWTTLRKEKQESDGAEYIQSEWEIREHIEGDQKRDSKYPAFRQRTYLAGDDADKVNKNVQKLLNQAFTFGVDADLTTDDTLVESLQAVIGKIGFIRGWNWAAKEGPRQSFVVQKPEVAEKKRNAASTPF